jgi:phage terminase large subunit-like protein
MTTTPPPAWAVRTEADRRALAAGYYWDQAAADRVIRFAEAYVQPKYTSGEFTLFRWQRRFLQSLYGWRRPDGGRRFQKAVLHVPKKNGKTLLVSILALYELVAAGVPSPLVVSASTTKDNAKQVYEQLAAAIAREPKLKALCRPVEFRRLIRAEARDGEYRALSADAPAAEGLNCSAVVVDEAHAHRSPRLYRTLEYAIVGRPDGLMVVISTAGDDLTHWYYALVVRARAVLAGTDTDVALYAEVYEASPDEDLEDPSLWKRCNPSLDEYPGFTSDRFRNDLLAAKSCTADWLSFQRYRLNVFRRSEDAGWVDLAAWDRCKGAVPEAELLAAPCWLGFDASQRVDPTSLAAVWLLPGRKYFVRSWAWVAEAGVRERERQNLTRYQQFIAEGCMHMTAGDMIDREPIAQKVRDLKAAGHRIRAVVMDPNGAWVFGGDLAAEGFEVFRMPQSFRYFNEPTREFEAAVAGGLLAHDGNGWLRWCVNSVRLDTDTHGNCRPARSRSADHIDGAVAALMAFALALKAAAEPPPPDLMPGVFLL